MRVRERGRERDEIERGRNRDSSACPVRAWARLIASYALRRMPIVAAALYVWPRAVP